MEKGEEREEKGDLEVALEEGEREKVGVGD